jgi:hypothetical protein
MPLGDEYFEQHIRSRSVRPPKTLYKYTSAETARKILAARKLRYQSPLNYNDPHDSQWDPLWFVRTPECGSRARAMLDRALRDPSTLPSGMDADLRSALAAEVARISALPNEQQRERARRSLLEAIAEPVEDSITVKDKARSLRQRMRVLCLCENDLSMLMWSHYADQHRGVVLGFDTEKYEGTHRRPFEKVSYSAKLPMLFDADALAQAMAFGLPIPEMNENGALALTKSQEWEYECEWRFVWVAPKGTVGEHQDYDLPPEALVEIVFGCRADQRTVKELSESARAIQPKVAVASVATHPGQFELVKRRIDDADLLNCARPPSSTEPREEGRRKT